MKAKAKWWHVALGIALCIAFCIAWWNYSMQPKDIYPPAPRGVYAEQAEKAAEIEQRVFSKAFRKRQEFKKKHPNVQPDMKKIVDEAIVETQEEDRQKALASNPKTAMPPP